MTTQKAIETPELPDPLPRFPLFSFRNADGTVCELYADSRYHEGLQEHMFPLFNGVVVMLPVVIREMYRQGVKPELCEWLHRSLIGHRGWTPYSAKT